MPVVVAVVAAAVGVAVAAASEAAAEAASAEVAPAACAAAAVAIAAVVGVSAAVVMAAGTVGVIIRSEQGSLSGPWQVSGPRHTGPHITRCPRPAALLIPTPVTRTIPVAVPGTSRSMKAIRSSM